MLVFVFDLNMLARSQGLFFHVDEEFNDRKEFHLDGQMRQCATSRVSITRHGRIGYGFNIFPASQNGRMESVGISLK